MKGYCSNSPVRCSLAESCDIIESEDHCCPKCLKALIVVDNEVREVQSVIKILLNTIVVIAIIATVLAIITLNFDS